MVREAQGNIFIDIGSNLGYYSKLAKKRFRGVLSIDPNPKYHADMRVAISNKDGRAMFYIGDGRGGADSLLHNPHISGKEWTNDSPIQVQTMTYDQLMLDADLVKIDVEGAEFDIIEGMKLYLPKRVIIELHDERREQELLSKMGDKGYESEKLGSSHFLFRRLS